MKTFTVPTKNFLSIIQGRNGEQTQECYLALFNWLKMNGFKSELKENCVVAEIEPKKYYGISVFIRAFYNVYIQADNKFRFILKERF